ncbi:EAL domain-containing protein [Roseibium sp. MMSF_3412]|uniref:EAL domain-containing protein n=1 Tax=Roseibium sp. MMSF_3412 TaxID=3046712 RepID=UPI00273FB059|nr:EAL domain-containing protein [Roseibium sp. MMSF_3412]
MDLMGDAVAVGQLLPGASTVHLVHVNRAFSDLFGYRPEDVLGRDMACLFDETRSRTSGGPDLQEVVEQGKAHVVEDDCLRSDGSRVRVSISFVAAENTEDGGQFLCATFRQTGERAQADGALSESDRLRAALNAFPDPVALYDKDKRLRFWNKAFAGSLSETPADIRAGMSLEELLRIGLENGRFAEAQGQEEAWLQKQILFAETAEPASDLELAGDIHQRVLRSRTANGDLLVVRFDTTKISQERKASDRTHTRLVAALNAYPDPIVIYDKDLNLVRWNDGYAASVTDNPDDLNEGMHLRDVLRLAVEHGRYPEAVGQEDAWVDGIMTPENLGSGWEDVELDGDVHHRLLRSRSSNGDYVVIRLNSTEFVRQKRTAEAAQARLLAALNAYPAPFVIYDSDDCLVVCNDAYRASMTNDPDELKAGMHRTLVARIAIAAGKIANALGREEEWMSNDHQDVDVAKPVQDLELPGDVHHRLLRTRVENGDLVMLRIDTTELVRQRRALEETQDRLFAAINAYPDPFAIYDENHKLVIWNPAYAVSMSDDPGEISAGASLKDLLVKAAECGRIPAAIGRETEWVETYYTPDVLEPGVEDFEFSDDQHHRMVRSRTEKGEYVVLRLNITEVVRQRRALEQYSARLEKANQEITYKALHDDLTGLGNRRYLTQKFEDFVRRRDQAGGEIAALHIDLDRFKQINDTMGHAAGDEVLLDISRRILARVEAEDVVARIGGDEFVVLLYVTGDAGRPEQLANVLLEDLARPMRYEGKICRFGASIGLARTPLADVDQLLTNSDVALYKAKRRGRGQLGIFDRADLAEVQRTKEIADDLLRAIENDEFVPFYQPQVNAVTRQVVGIEALARWHHPEKGILTPAAFLSVATDLHVAADIDRMIFERAVQECQQAFGAYGEPLSLSFNVSENRINDSEIKAIRDCVNAYSGQISFELLETIFLEEQDDDFLARLRDLRDLGVGIEVDDFGSGRASVVALQRINPDRLKIDRRLVSLVAEGSGGLRLLRSIIEIGQALELGVTAEGVETREQAEILTRLGCDRLQGYYFARPMAFSDLLNFLDTPDSLVRGA